MTDVAAGSGGSTTAAEPDEAAPDAALAHGGTGATATANTGAVVERTLAWSRGLPRRVAPYWPLLAVVALALAIRLLAVTSWLPTCTDAQIRARPAPGECYAIGGDAYYYRSMALNLATGDGFQITAYDGTLHPKADRPPAFVMFLAGLDSLGMQEVGQHRMAMAILGGLGCGLVGLLGWRLNPRAPRATAVLLGGIAAVYPGFWMSDALYLSESLYVPLFALTLLGAVRFWRRPDWLSAVLLGAAAGSVWLTRGEGAVFLGVFSIAVVVFLRSVGLWRRVALCVGACAVCIGMMVPWVLHNLSRFEEPVYIATTGTAFALNSCDETWYGPATGWYSFGCLNRYTAEVIAEDGVFTDAALRAKGTDYIAANLSRYPVVMAVRVGRVFEVWERDDTFARNTKSEGRPDEWVGPQRLIYELLLLPGLAGIVLLARRREPAAALIAAGVTAAAGVAGTFAIYRYRLAADLALFSAASVAMVAAVQWAWPRALDRFDLQVPPWLQPRPASAPGDEPHGAPGAASAPPSVPDAGASKPVAAPEPAELAPSAKPEPKPPAKPAPEPPAKPEPKPPAKPAPKPPAKPEPEPVAAGLWAKGGVMRAEGARLLELAGLWAIAVVQPVLDVFGKAGEELVARRVSASGLVVFALALALVPPLVLLGVTSLLRFVSPKAETAAHKVVLALLVGGVVLQALGTAIDSPVPQVIALAVSGGVGFVLFRFDSLRAWPRYLSPAGAAFVALFLFSSGATPIVFDSSAATGPGPALANPRPVVMVVFDELPMTSLLDGKGGIDADLYPNFAALQRESTWFRQNSSPAAGTNWAVPAIMTGNYPGTIASPISSVYKNSIFSYLSGSLTMEVQEVVTRLCDPSICKPYELGEASASGSLYSRAADVWVNRATAGPSGGSATTGGDPGASTDTPAFYLPPDMHSPQRMKDFVGSLEGSGPPTFHFAHMILPHLPFEYTPAGRVCSDGFPQYPIGANQWLGSWVSSWGGVSAKSRHLLQLQYLDAWMGEIIKQLKASGLWDDAVVIFTADHGLNFEPGQLRAFTEENWHNLIYTPLFMRGPGLTPGTVDDRNANVMDIAPTIGEMMGTPLNYQTVGRSLLGAPDPAPIKKAIRNPRDTKPANGSYVEFDVKEGQRRLMQAAAGSPSQGAGDDLRLFRIGDYQALVGKKVADFTLGAPATYTATVDPPGLSRTFNASAGEVACMVKGTDTATTPRHIAIALNGTVLAVSPTGIEGQGQSFWAALPETRFVEGANTVTLFDVEGTPEQPTLRPIG